MAPATLWEAVTAFPGVAFEEIDTKQYLIDNWALTKIFVSPKESQWGTGWTHAASAFSQGLAFSPIEHEAHPTPTCRLCPVFAPRWPSLGDVEMQALQLCYLRGASQSV